MWPDHIPNLTPLRVITMTADAGAVGLIAGAITGWLPPLAAILAIVWYVIQIYESSTLQKKLRSYRLRRLVRIRAEAVALELLLRGNKSADLRGLDEANQVHLAATSKATELTHDALKEEQIAIEGERIETALLALNTKEIPKKK